MLLGPWDFRTEDGHCNAYRDGAIRDQERCIRCKGEQDIVSNDTLLPGSMCTYYRSNGNKCDWPKRKY